MSSRATTRFGFLLALVVGVAPACLLADETEDSLKHAEVVLGALKRTLKPRMVPEATVRALDAAAAALEGLFPPPKPDLVPSEPEADAAALHAVAEENERRLRGWGHASRMFSRRKEKFLSSWVKLLGTALTLERAGVVWDFDFHIGEASRRRRSLTFLLATGRPDAANEIMKASSKWLRSNSLYDEPHPLVDALDALPRFNSPDVLRWLRTKFIGKERDFHLIGCMSRRAAGAWESTYGVDVSVLALQAIAEHTEMPGNLRLRTVRDLVAAYRSLEIQAERGGDHAAVWGRVGQAAIAATWRLARKPTDEGGVPLSSMAKLARWFRRNKTLEAAAWKD